MEIKDEYLDTFDRCKNWILYKVVAPFVVFGSITLIVYNILITIGDMP